MAYATVSDVELRYRPLDADEVARCEVLLDDAATMIDSLVKVNDPDEDFLKRLKLVSCNMVIRCMRVPELDAYGITQTSMTAGSYSQSYTFSNPTGDMYMTHKERQLLGIGAQLGGMIKVAIHDWNGDQIDW